MWSLTRPNADWDNLRSNLLSLTKNLMWKALGYNTGESQDNVVRHPFSLWLHLIIKRHFPLPAAKWRSNSFLFASQMHRKSSIQEQCSGLCKLIMLLNRLNKVKVLNLPQVVPKSINIFVALMTRSAQSGHAFSNFSTDFYCFFSVSILTSDVL